MAEGQRDGEGIPEQVTSEIFTAANVVSFVRLCLVPVYLWLLLSGFNLAATLVFAAAAASDFIDGQLARRTHTVSKLGQIYPSCSFLKLSRCSAASVSIRLPLGAFVFIQ